VSEQEPNERSDDLYPMSLIEVGWSALDQCYRAYLWEIEHGEPMHRPQREPAIVRDGKTPMEATKLALVAWELLPCKLYRKGYTP